MVIIMGASGQVGSAIAAHLAERGQRVRGVIRNPGKAGALKQKGKNFMQMTQTIVDGKTNPEREGAIPAMLPTTFKQYLEEKYKEED